MGRNHIHIKTLTSKMKRAKIKEPCVAQEPTSSVSD
jgi:hypothetical protein